MKFMTPFRFHNDVLCNCDYEPLQLSSREYVMGEDMERALRLFKATGANFIHLTLRESETVAADGTVTGSFERFDRFMEIATELRLYVGLTITSEWTFDYRVPERMSEYDTIRSHMRRFDLWMTALFTHANSFSGKRLYEYPALAAIEPLRNVDGLAEREAHWFSFLLSPYIDHYFTGRVLKVCFNAPYPEAAVEGFARWGYRSLLLQSESDLQFEEELPGLPKAGFRAAIRRTGEAGWKPLAAVATWSRGETPHRNGGAEGFVSFAAAGGVELEFTFPVPVQSAKFRPSLRKPLPVQMDGNCVRLAMPENRYGVIEVNYDVEESAAFTVYLLNDRILPVPEMGKGVKLLSPGRHTLAELAEEAKQLWFLPGVHEVEGDKLILQSNCDVHLCNGAVLRANIAGDRVENVRITGRGVIDATPCLRLPGENWRSLGEEGVIFFLHGRNVVIDGPILYNPQFWAVVVAGTEGVRIRNFKVLAWLVNDDGIQPRSVNDFESEHCFLKCFDDCVAVKTRRAIGMHSEGLLFHDLVLWKDAGGHGLEIGHTSQADLLCNVQFRDIEIVAVGGGSGLSINVLDHQTVRDVLYDRIYIEGKPFPWYARFTVHGEPSPYRSDDGFGRIENVTIRNLFLEGAANRAGIFGFDAEHLVENVVFSHVCEHGSTPVTEFTKLNIEQRHASGIRLES